MKLRPPPLNQFRFRSEMSRGCAWEFNDFLPDLRFVGGKIIGIAEDTPRLRNKH